MLNESITHELNSYFIKPSNVAFKFAIAIARINNCTFTLKNASVSK